MRDVTDRLREHLDAAAPPIDVDLLVGCLVAFDRTDEMPVTTLTPEHDTRPDGRRNYRVGLVLAAAAFVTILAIGIVAWLGGGSPPVAEEPEDVPPTGVSTDAPESKEGAPSSLTTTVDQIVLPSATVVTLDAAVTMQWAQPSIEIASDGELRILYQRDGTTVALIECIGAACAEAAPVDVFDVGVELGWLIGTPRTDGPVFWLGAGPGVAASSLVVCADDACESPAIIPMPGAVNAPGVPSVGTTPNGTPLVSSMNGVYPSDIITLRCMEPTCVDDWSNWVTWSSAADEFIGRAAIAQTEGSPPVLALAAEESLIFGTCRHDNCRPESELIAGFSDVVVVPLPAAVFRGPELMLRSDGSPVAVVYLENGPAEDVVAVSCDTPACANPEVTPLGTVDDSFSEWGATLGSDGRLRVAWTEDGTLWLAACTDVECSAFDMRELDQPARDVAIAVGPEGFPVLVTSSLDRGLELLTCTDELCSVTSE